MAKIELPFIPDSLEGIEKGEPVAYKRGLRVEVHSLDDFLCDFSDFKKETDSGDD